jgi:N-acetylglucosaminyldiphosphoundecaprenol N-acetyl-beta-D-mannosaminyltransferase
MNAPPADIQKMMARETIQTTSPDALPSPTDICGFPVRPLDQQQLINTLLIRARNNIQTTVHYLNAHTFNLAQQDPEFHKNLTTSDLLYADGISVVLAGRLLGQPLPQRLTAADYFETFCRQCARMNLSLFLLGGASGVSEKTAQALTERIENLQVKGTHKGYFDDNQSPAIVKNINDSGANILIVGMGSPKQEKWLAANRNHLTIPLRWSVGALMDYFANRELRAPQWLCRIGGEWLFRLIHRPGQRWRRYLLGNARFAYYVLTEKMLCQKGKHSS